MLAAQGGPSGFLEKGLPVGLLLHNMNTLIRTEEVVSSLEMNHNQSKPQKDNSQFLELWEYIFTQ